jgi:hypothetical protein
MLIQIVRHELDPTTRDAVFAAQRETRRTDGNTPESAVAVYLFSRDFFPSLTCSSRFMNVIKRPCGAVDANGRKCTGKPKLISKKNVSLIK